MTEISTDMAEKICLVTGATSGIGLATALALAQMNATTVIVGRSQKKSENTIRRIKNATGNENIDYLLADLSSQKDIFQLTKNFKKRYPQLDILINNAGAKFVNRLETVDGLEMSFALNHLSYFTLSMLVLELLKKSSDARIINVSSGAHSACPGINFSDLQFENTYVGKKAYAQSKLANLLFTYELAERLAGNGITVNALTPGGVATNFCRNNGWISWSKHILAHLMTRSLIGPAEAAKTSVYLATSPEVRNISGKYFSKQKTVRSSAASHDKDAAKRLWEISIHLSGLSESTAAAMC